MVVEAKYLHSLYLIEQLDPKIKRVVDAIIKKINESKFEHTLYTHNQTVATHSSKKHHLQLSKVELNDENSYMDVYITNKKTLESMEIKLFSAPLRYHQMETESQKNNYEDHLFGSRYVTDQNNTISYKMAEFKMSDAPITGENAEKYNIYSVSVDTENPTAFVVNGLTNETQKSEPMDHIFELVKEKRK